VSTTDSIGRGPVIGRDHRHGLEFGLSGPRTSRRFVSVKGSEADVRHPGHSMSAMWEGRTRALDPQETFILSVSLRLLLAYLLV